MDQARCPVCHEAIHWMPTYLSRRLRCFEARAVPRELDTDDEGWVPGLFLVDGVHQLLLAPIAHHPDDKARRAQHVLLPHVCRPGKEHDE
jgi:hypothetical protein